MRVIQAAFYARVAGETQQTKHAIASQLEAMRDQAGGSGMEIVVDEGSSGLRLDRAGMDRMRDEANGGRFDVLLRGGPDRLARNLLLQRLIIKDMGRCGVGTIFLGSGPAEDALSTLDGMMGAASQFEDANFFFDALSPGSGQRDLYCSRQGVE